MRALRPAASQVIDESYNANPASMAAALALLAAKGRARSRCWATCWKWARAAIAHHAGLAAPIDANKVDLVFASGAQMKALWDALPASRRGAYAETSAALLPLVTGGAESRRHRAGQRLQRRENVRDHRSTQRKAA